MVIICYRISLDIYVNISTTISLYINVPSPQSARLIFMSASYQHKITMSFIYHCTRGSWTEHKYWRDVGILHHSVQYGSYSLVFVGTSPGWPCWCKGQVYLLLISRNDLAAINNVAGGYANKIHRRLTSASSTRSFPPPRHSEEWMNVWFIYIK